MGVAAAKGVAWGWWGRWRMMGCPQKVVDWMVCEGVSVLGQECSHWVLAEPWQYKMGGVGSSEVTVSVVPSSTGSTKYFAHLLIHVFLTLVATRDWCHGPWLQNTCNNNYDTGFRSLWWMLQKLVPCLKMATSLKKSMLVLVLCLYPFNNSPLDHNVQCL